MSSACFRIAACILIQTLAVSVVAAQAVAADAPGHVSGEAWVNDGLAVTTRSVEATMMNGLWGDREISVASQGHEIAYVRTKASLKDDENRLDLCLIDVRHPADEDCVSHYASVRGLYTAFAPSLSSDGQQLAYFLHESGPTKAPNAIWKEPLGETIAVRKVASGTTQLLKPADVPSTLFGPHTEITGFRSFKWSPDGARLGVVVGTRLDRTISTGLEVSITDMWGTSVTDPSAAPRRLVLLDVGAGKWTLASPANIDVDSFDWAPNGRQIALSGSVNASNSHLPYEYTDLFLVDLASQTTKPIAVQPGRDADPVWSPDGRWIAFGSQRGVIRWIGGEAVGLYNVATSAVTYPAFEELRRISGSSVHGIAWTPDSRSLWFVVPYQMSHQLFSVSVPGGTLTRVTVDEGQDYSAAKFLDHGKSVVFMSESFMEPPELYESSPQKFHARRLTHMNSDLGLPDVEFRQLSWPSQDRKWTVHGWLLLPKAAKSPQHLPLLVYAEGGPVMSHPYFRVGGYQYPVHALLANGVAVLIPNSRGRAGYGVDFQTAWETERDFGRGPLGDDLAGVDALVKAGIADPDRVALAGSSWGGYLAAFALTQTDRFKTIFVHEAVSLDPLSEGLAVAGSSDLREFASQLGKGVPLMDAEMARLKSLAPDYQVGHATTPALLEFGEDSLLKDGLVFFQGLKYFNKAPVELISYPHAAHGTEEPALRYDSARRDLEWFAYWVLGKPTQRMLDKYGPPKIAEWKN